MTRTAKLAIALASVTLGGLTACAPPAEAPWPAPGCYTNASPTVSSSDIRYNGEVDTRNNIEVRGKWVGSTWNSSSDGTCTGPDVIAGTLVRADDVAGATDACAELGYSNADWPIRFLDLGYDFPADAWACVNDLGTTPDLVRPAHASASERSSPTG